MNRPRTKTFESFPRYFEKTLNYATVAGFTGTIIILFRFATTSPEIVLRNAGVLGITIQGVPFLWIIWSLTLASLRTFYNALKSLTSSDVTRLIIFVATILAVNILLSLAGR